MTLLQLNIVVLGALLVRVNCQNGSCAQSSWQSKSVSAGVANPAKTAVPVASLDSCVNLCKIANQMPLPTNTSTCYMAEYNQNTLECILTNTCPSQPQVTNTNMVTCINPFCFDYFQIPASPTVAMQLTLSCDFIPVVFGAAGLSGKVNISSDLIAYTSGLSPRNLIYFSYLDFSSRASRYLQVVSPVSASVQSSFKPLDVFGGSFTIALAFKVDGSLPDTPLIEFLGAASAQVCYTIRMGCYGNCIQAFISQSCACTTGTIYKISASINTKDWTHLAIVYDNSTNATTYYLNGIVYSFTAGNSNPSVTYSKQVQVTRLRVGTSECDWFNGQQTNYQGWIYCVNLYNYTLTQQQVGQLYTFCNSLRSA